MGSAFGLNRLVDLAAPMHVDDVVEAKGRVGQELALPMSVGLLKAKEVLLGAANAFLHRYRFPQDRKSGDFERHHFGGGKTHRDRIFQVTGPPRLEETRGSFHAAAGCCARGRPVLWPFPEETPLNGSTCAPSGRGAGLGAKLKTILRQVSPRCPHRPRVALGS